MADNSDSGSVSRTSIGVIISVLGNTLVSLAFSTQKYAHKLLQEKEERGETTSYVKSPVWWFGIMLMVCGEVGNFTAYGFAPSSVVAPLGTVTLVVNAIVAPIFLKEKFRLRDLLGILIAVSGTVLIIVSSTTGNVASIISEDELKASYAKPQSIVFDIYTLLMIFVLYQVIKTTHVLLLEVGLVALCGSFTILATKGVSTLVTIGVDHAFESWLFYVLLVILLGTAFLQVKYLNQCLQRYDATLVLPMHFVLFNLASIGGSAITFNDFASMTALQFTGFCGGCLLNFAGIYVISSNRHPKEEHAPQHDKEENPQTFTKLDTSSVHGDDADRDRLMSLNSPLLMYNAIVDNVFVHGNATGSPRRLRKSFQSMAVPNNMTMADAGQTTVNRPGKRHATFSAGKGKLKASDEITPMESTSESQL